MIGAGAVVTKNVKDFALVIGNPAKQIGWVSRRGIKLVFNASQVAICSQSKLRYELKDNQVFEILSD